jgi:hypothetical protein
MTLPRVKDHVDIISSAYFKELIQRYLYRLYFYLAFHPDWRTLYDQIASLPEPKTGDPVRPSYINLLADACQKMCSHHNINPPANLQRVSDFEWVRDSHVNALADCIETLESMSPPAAKVYLFDTNDWVTAKQYVTDYSIIFCTYDIDTLTSDEVAALVSSREVVFVIEMDTEPYHQYDAPAWYKVFYTALAPPACGHDVYYVTDPDFQRFFGTGVPSVWDYCVSLTYKVSGTKNWAGDSCGWGYKRYEQGAIIEVPCDGVWVDVDWLGRYVDAISSILLDVGAPRTILYLGDYISNSPWAHICYPCYVCWKALTQARGWQLFDLRK